jgi:hypothetical protein
LALAFFTIWIFMMSPAAMWNRAGYFFAASGGISIRYGQGSVLRVLALAFFTI